MSRKRKILCTLGPSSLNARTIERLDQIGIDIFRLNLSHTKLGELESQLCFIREHTKRPICLDTEGAQVRTGLLEKGQVFLKLNRLLHFVRKPIVGNDQRMNLYPNEVYDQLDVGEFLYLDATSVVQIVEKESEGLVGEVLAEGFVGQHKAVSTENRIHLHPLTQKDKKAIEIGLSLGVEHIALSFASSKSSVDSLRELIGQDVNIISKIENQSGLENFEEISEKSEAILIDRGDLAREIPIEAIPFTQKWIIKRAKTKGIPVYVATNLLESMVTNKEPNRAEVNDVMNTLMDGADGLVLAAESAVGARPVACANMVSKLINFYEMSPSAGNKWCGVDSLYSGTWPVKQFVSHSESNPVIKKKKKLRRIMVDERVIMDAEQICLKTFAPLNGFVSEEELNTILKDYRLPNGEVWPMPVLLPVSKSEASRLNLGEEVALVSRTDGQIYASLIISDIFTQDFSRLALQWYGTKANNHPGVQWLSQAGKYYLGGSVKLLKRRVTPYSRYEFSPTQTRKVFQSRGWITVVGFHTRNVVHKAHEKLLRLALERTAADGVFVNPVIGHKKFGDFDTNVILESYEMLFRGSHSFKSQVLLGAFSTYSRYCGPREAVFTAICRRNFGCTHFIVGRDHTGVGKFYKTKESRELLESLGDIGIELVFFENISYCSKCDDYVERCSHAFSTSLNLEVSGSSARRFLQQGKVPPAWMMRPEVAEMVLKKISNGRRVFVNNDKAIENETVIG